MRILNMDRAMPHPPNHKRESLRTWLSGLAVSMTAVVAYFAFWHLSPILTFMVGCVALVALISAAWHYGRATRLSQAQEKEPPQLTDLDA